MFLFYLERMHAVHLLNKRIDLEGFSLTRVQTRDLQMRNAGQPHARERMHDGYSFSSLDGMSRWETVAMFLFYLERINAVHLLNKRIDLGDLSYNIHYNIIMVERS